MDDYIDYIDACSRRNNGMPPARAMPKGEAVSVGVVTPGAPRSIGARSLKSRHVGLRLTQADYELLEELARAHAVSMATMARMLVTRGVRAAADSRT
jgi:hypothetical protein